LFIASDTVDIASQIGLVGDVSCSEFNRWLKLTRSGHRIDFRRIERVGSGLGCLRDYTVNLFGFEERSMIDECDIVRNTICHRFEDERSIFVKSIAHSESVKESEI
jgi:hypothetical protein